MSVISWNLDENATSTQKENDAIEDGHRVLDKCIPLTLPTEEMNVNVDMDENNSEQSDIQDDVLDDTRMQAETSNLREPGTPKMTMIELHEMHDKLLPVLDRSKVDDQDGKTVEITVRVNLNGMSVSEYEEKHRTRIVNYVKRL
jgi:hypothetical protein